MATSGSGASASPRWPTSCTRRISWPSPWHSWAWWSAQRRDLGADAILATTSTPSFEPLLRSQWYLPLSGNVHFLFRDVAETGPAFGQALSDWWICRGDGQADDAL